jgi:hypothetical protein
MVVVHPRSVVEWAVGASVLILSWAGEVLMTRPSALRSWFPVRGTDGLLGSCLSLMHTGRFAVVVAFTTLNQNLADLVVRTTRSAKINGMYLECTLGEFLKNLLRHARQAKVGESV